MSRSAPSTPITATGPRNPETRERPPVDPESGTTPAPPPYSLIDATDKLLPSPPPSRRVTRTGVDAVTRRSRAPPTAAAAARALAATPPTAARSPPPTQSPPRRTSSHSTTHSTSSATLAPPNPNLGRPHSHHGHSSGRHSLRPSRSASGSRDNNGPATADASVGGFRAQMLQQAASSSSGPAPGNSNAVGTRHATLTIVPPTTASDVTGNPLMASPVQQRSSTTTRTRTGDGLQRRGSVEDPLEYLRRYDTVCIVDDSSSMEGALWFEARDALAGIADVAARYDSDGVDIYFLNDPAVGKNLSTGSEVKRLFDRVTPQGITPTGEKLEELLLDYLLRLEHAKASAASTGNPSALKAVKPVNFLVITDGQPTDDPAPVIVQAAKRLDEGHFPLSQVGIQFVQIGSDPAAAEALREMDDDLAAANGIRDMVDTVPFSAEGSQLGSDTLVKILLGGINRRQDRRKASIG